MTLPGQTAGVLVFFDPITTDLGISHLAGLVKECFDPED